MLHSQNTVVTFRSTPTLQCALPCDEIDSMCDASTSWKLCDESAAPPVRTQSSTWSVSNFWLARCLLPLCASERSWQENIPDWGFMYATSDVCVWPYRGSVALEYKMFPRESVSVDVNRSETDDVTFITYLLTTFRPCNDVLTTLSQNFQDWKFVTEFDRAPIWTYLAVKMRDTWQQSDTKSRQSFRHIQ